MITIDLGRIEVVGKRVLDLGCGTGRHSFAMARAGAHVISADLAEDEVKQTQEWLDAMRLKGEIPDGTATLPMRANAYSLPYASGSFDVVVISEVLEHLPRDTTAMAEIERVLAPGGELIVTVPTFGPELVCWALSTQYHSVPGGHIRIYRRGQLLSRLRGAGFTPTATYHAHALHSPYWWLKCFVGTTRDVAPVRAYHKLLVWDMTAQPAVTRVAEKMLSPVIGKSLVVHLQRA